MSDVVGCVSFAFFLAWVYCISTTETVVSQYQNNFWVLIGITWIGTFIWLYIQVMFSPEEYNRFGDKIKTLQDIIKVVLQGLAQILIGLSIVVTVFFLRKNLANELIYLWTILATLFIYRGKKFISGVIHLQ